MAARWALRIPEYRLGTASSGSLGGRGAGKEPAQVHLAAQVVEIQLTVLRYTRSSSPVIATIYQ